MYERESAHPRRRRNIEQTCAGAASRSRENKQNTKYKGAIAFAAAAKVAELKKFAGGLHKKIECSRNICEFVNNSSKTNNINWILSIEICRKVQVHCVIEMKCP
uniref:Uncharacterized protein n=1 Tax=Ceratitis capitata TaxID=7213 RepID=W8BCR2_CERCA